MITDQSAQYYAKSATTLDQAYTAPERQDDLEEMMERVADLVDGHKVLELACGTGWWTAVLADSAESVLATDINPGLIALGQARGLDEEVVQWRVVDAFRLPEDLGQFSAIFIGFWWSHIRRDQQDKFLARLRALFGKDTLLILLDDVYVEGSSPTVARTDLDGNTYKIETAPDGERYEIPKTYPADSSLRKRLGGAAREIKLVRLEYYWLLSCRLK
jgi:SAM-dependent methyltransferase